ncbi:DUF58 domain-containing protein [Opitutaceae bacterium EW11]|nr:DUF58 domain-containing protein [Opitutaceae bacterium EW11]
MTPVPAQRLLVVVAALVPVAAAAGPLASLRPLALLLGVGAFVVALLDLILGLARPAEIAIEVPDVVRFSKDRAGAIPVTFVRPRPAALRIRFALGLPATFTPAVEELWIDLPGDAKQSRIDWMATPRSRGRDSSVLACFEFFSRFRLWTLRRRWSVPCELRVYPNLFSERRQLAALFLARGQFGAKLQRTVGRGREFEKLREYLPGDGFDEIHWKATAKRGHPVTKVFQVERTQEIYVILDASRLSARPLVHEGVRQTALERYLTAALVLLLAAERQGDHFGLMVYDDRVRLSLKAGYGEGHYAACREAIYRLKPSQVSPDMAEVVRHLRSRIRRRALLVFLTDLADPVLAEDFARHVKLLSRQHLVFVNQLRAPGVERLFSGEEIADSDEVYSKLAGHARWTEAKSLAQTLKPLGVTASLLEHETLAAELVTQYLAVKQRQLL